MGEVQGKRKEPEGKAADAGSQGKTGPYKVGDIAGVELLQGGCGPSCPAALSLAVFRAVQEEELSSGEVAVPRGQRVQPLPLCCTHLQWGRGLAHLLPEPVSLQSLPRVRGSCRQEQLQQGALLGGCGHPGAPRVAREASG